MPGILFLFSVLPCTALTASPVLQSLQEPATPRSGRRPRRPSISLTSSRHSNENIRSDVSGFSYSLLQDCAQMSDLELHQFGHELLDSLSIVR